MRHDRRAGHGRRGGDAIVGRVAVGPVTVDVARFGIVPPIDTAEGDIAAMAMYAGESAALVDAVEPAAEVIARTVRQADDLLRRIAPGR